MRKPHYIKPNQRQELPREFIFFDVETVPVPLTTNENQAVLLMGWAVYHHYNPLKKKYEKTKWHYFEDNQSFWDFVFSKNRSKTKLYLLAHNAGGFDLMVTEFAKYFQDAEYECISAVLDCPPLIVTYRNTDRTIVILDSLNYFRQSLKSLGDSIGLEKLDVDNIEDLRNVDKEIIKTYCKRDVEIISESILGYLNFIQDNDLGNFKTTQPAQAFNAFKHRFMIEQTIFCDNNELALDISRQSYFGGRTEAFWLGTKKSKFYVLDINSMYPYVMKNNLFPIKLWTVRKLGIEKDEVFEYFKDYFVVASVVINTDKNCIPFRDNKGRLIFPTGKFSAIIPQPELELLNYNEILKFNSIAVYEKDAIFSEYIEYFYGLKNKYKNEKNPVYYDLSKKFLNTLYGKFGQRGSVYTEIGKTDYPTFKTETILDGDTNKIRKIRYVGNLIQELDDSVESQESMPAIASAVTSYARVVLYDLIQKAGKKHCYYSDTDGLIVDEIGLKNLKDEIDEDKLGKLKLEQTVETLEIRGLKDYKKDDIERIKGVRLSSNSTVKIDDNTFEQDQFRSLKGAIFQDGDVNRMIISRQVKHLKREYSKAEKGADGWLIPFNLK